MKWAVSIQRTKNAPISARNINAKIVEESISAVMDVKEVGVKTVVVQAYAAMVEEDPSVLNAMDHRFAVTGGESNNA